jgi:putative FmdB family regulatory protein
MPYYEYRCANCVNTFELFAKSMISSSEEASPSCPQCSSDDTMRVVTRVSVLKGAGPGLGAAAYPMSWSATNHGDLETIHYWRDRLDKERTEEAKDTGLAHERLLYAERRYRQVVERTVPTAALMPESHDQVSDRVHNHDHGHERGAVPATEFSNVPLEGDVTTREKGTS